VIARPPLEGPLTFVPRLKHYLWGGRRLEQLFGRVLPDGVTAESWEVSGHPDEPSVVDRGPLAGRELPGLVDEYGIELVGRRGARAVERGTFPLLVKLLDASHALSVQVHPDDAYAATHLPGETGKTEVWYVVHTEPGARIIHGLRPGIGRADLHRAIAEGRVQDVLGRVAVRPGDSVMVPAGTVHGVLSGIVLVEVQQTSDTTYRIYDWDRVGPDGKPRELHVERALEVIDFGRREPARAEPRLVGEEVGIRREAVAECGHFVVERVRAEAGAVFGESLDGETFEIWGTLEGRAALGAPLPLEGSGSPGVEGSPALQMETARFALLPATMGRYEFRAGTDVVALRAYLP